MKENNLAIKVLIDPNVVIQEVDDELVLLHMKTEQYFSLDDVGTVMYRLLTESNSTQEVVQALLGQYDVDENRLRQDLASFIEKLAEKELIAIIDE